MVPLSDLKLTVNGKRPITINTKAFTQYLRFISWYLLPLNLAKMKVKVKGAVTSFIQILTAGTATKLSET